FPTSAGRAQVAKRGGAPGGSRNRSRRAGARRDASRRAQGVHRSRSEVARPEGVGTVRGERERGATLPDERRACAHREARWRARRESEPFAASGSEARRFPTSAGRAHIAKRGGAPGGSRNRSRRAGARRDASRRAQGVRTSRSEVARPEGVGTVRGERERAATLPDERRACNVAKRGGAPGGSRNRSRR